MLSFFLDITFSAPKSCCLYLLLFSPSARESGDISIGWNPVSAGPWSENGHDQNKQHTECHPW
jgi:hypothetical protein